MPDLVFRTAELYLFGCQAFLERRQQRSFCPGTVAARVVRCRVVHPSGRLATRWGEELAQSSTVRISAPSDQLASQTEAALRVLSSTKGVASARALTKTEQQALLEPWLGPDVPVDTLPVPQLIEVIEAPEGYDVAGLRLRLLAEVSSFWARASSG